MFNVKKIRADFPHLQRTFNNKNIVYLDSAATSLKPNVVIEKEAEYYKQYTANVFRGIYKTSEEATRQYELARLKVANFIGAKNACEVIFTRNTSESINLVAYSYLFDNWKAPDRIVATISEHHSNFVVWQQLGKFRGVEFEIVDINEDGELDLEQLQNIVTQNTKLVALTAVSNVLGTINPVTKIVRTIKRINSQCLVLIDAAQALPNMPVNVHEWGADFVAFSGHKMFGPTGVGVLWGKRELLEEMRPFNYGGEMISEVRRDSTVFKEIPYKFEAGTPHIAGVIGLGAAIDYLSGIGMEHVRAHEVELIGYAMNKFDSLGGLSYLGPRSAHKRAGVFAFTLNNIHAHDIAQVLDEDNIFIRAGNHCAMPLHNRLGLFSTARASLSIFTTKEDIDTLVMGLRKVTQVFTK